MEEILSHARELGLDVDSFIGCSEDEIQRLENEYNILLPEDYKSFLRYCGKKHDGMILDLHSDYEYILDINKKERIENMKREKKVFPPENCFIFASLYDDYMVFIDCSDNSVFYYSSEDLEPVFVAENFIVYLQECINSLA